jgi:hypothetical protein
VGAIGLIYVGAVLFVNGAMLLGWVEGRSAAPLNLFVGLLQVVTPTYLIFTAAGDATVLINASGLYLFGFTYLYVAFNLFLNLDGTGLGYFSLFVAVAAVAYSLFFLLLGRGQERLGRYTGGVAAIQGWVTGALPAALLLLGVWGRNATLIAWIFAIAGIVVFAALYIPLRQKRTADPSTSGSPTAATV